MMDGLAAVPVAVSSVHCAAGGSSAASSGTATGNARARWRLCEALEAGAASSADAPNSTLQATCYSEPPLRGGTLQARRA